MGDDGGRASEQRFAAVGRKSVIDQMEEAGERKDD
jgi:hypothetical protein